MLRDPSPVELEPRSMPTDDGIGIDNDERVLPSRPESEEGNPEDAIERCDLGLGFFMAIGGELLTKRQLDNGLLISASKQGRSAANDECQKVE